MAMYEHRIGAADYVAMLSVVLFCTGVGLYYSRKSKQQLQNLEGYLLANRSMGVLPAAFSILATKLSGISIAGATGEEYVYGPMYSLVFVGYCIGQVIVAVFIVPVFRSGNYISMYEYLERRFDKSVRYFFSILYFLSNLFYIGIVLYIPAVSVTALSGLRFEVTVIVTGLTCTLYCVTGGFTAVVWTDVVQTLIMFLSFGLVIIKGVVDGGGISKIYKESNDAGFFTAFSFVEREGLRYSVWSTLAAGIQSSFRDLCIGQAGVQRLLSVKDTKAAQKSTMASAALGLVFMLLLFLTSAILFANLHDCDPLLRKAVTGVTTPDQLYVYGVATLLGSVPGLTGIAVSGILSGAISSFSSHINAFAAITLEDYIMPVLPQKFTSEKSKVFICKVLTAFYGVLSILFAFLVPYMGGAVKATISIISIISGPLVGAVFMAIFVRRYNKKACFAGISLSVAVCIFLQLCSMWYPMTYETLPLTVDGCSLNTTIMKNVVRIVETFMANVTEIPTTAFNQTQTHYSFLRLFRISFMWYGIVGIIASMFFGYVFTLCSGDQYVDPKLMYTNANGRVHDRNNLDPLLTSKDLKNHHVQEDRLLQEHPV